MFLNTYTPRLDEKGRFFLPAKFRDGLADGLVITRAQDRCLAIYPLATFADKVQELRAAPDTLKEVRDYRRMLASGASDEVPDKQGRITIPTPLRRYAGLERDIAVSGQADWIEVWDLAAWEAYTGQLESGYAAMNTPIPGVGGPPGTG